MAKEIKAFNIDQVLDALCDKLIRRHPHVFGDVKAADSAQVLKNWEDLKAAERRSKTEATPNQQHTPESILASISRKLPALLEAHKLSSKACHVGFDWPDIEDLFDKLQEEVRELKAHIHRLPSGALAPRNQSRVPESLRTHLEDEVGDLFFVLVNIARYLSVEPEMALRRTNLKFRRRFGWMESQLRDEGVALDEASLDKMEELWQQAKTLEKAPK
jgi:MazG family protein